MIEEPTVVAAPRADVPVRRPYARGDQRIVQRILGSPATIKSAVRAAKKAQYAITTVGPKRSRRKLVRWILSRACGQPVVPVTTVALEVLTGVLREAKYRSTSQYLCEAKDLHVEEAEESARKHMDLEHKLVLDQQVA